MAAYRHQWSWPSFAVLMLLATGCIRPDLPLDLMSREPSQNHWEIASFYTREAAVFREKAEEQFNRVEVYKQLFGPNSDWVTGARLMGEFYQQQAQDREKQAEIHLSLANRRGQSNLEGVRSDTTSSVTPR